MESTKIRSSGIASSIELGNLTVTGNATLSTVSVANLLYSNGAPFVGGSGSTGYTGSSGPIGYTGSAGTGASPYGSANARTLGTSLVFGL